MVESVSIPLARLVFDYIKNNKEIDKSFIDKVIEIVVNNLNLNDYVRKIEIIDSSWNGSERIEGASYSFVSKKIIIRLRASIEFFIHDLKRLKINHGEEFFMIYDRIIQLILHELEHAHQYAKIDSKDQSLETKIIKYSILDDLLIKHFDAWFDKLVMEGYTEEYIHIYLSERRKRYLQYYKYAPIERLAEYHSHQTMATIFKEIGTLPNISYYECLKLCQNYLVGYKDGLVPTQFYYDKIKANHSYEELEQEGENLDFESRASLGLPISAEEYAYLLDTTNELKELIIR